MYAEPVPDSAHGQGLPVAVASHASIPSHMNPQFIGNKHDKPAQDQLLEGPNIATLKANKAAYYATDYIAGLLGGKKN